LRIRLARGFYIVAGEKVWRLEQLTRRGIVGRDPNLANQRDLDPNHGCIIAHLRKNWRGITQKFSVCQIINHA